MHTFLKVGTLVCVYSIESIDAELWGFSADLDKSGSLDKAELAAGGLTERERARESAQGSYDAPASTLESLLK